MLRRDVEPGAAQIKGFVSDIAPRASLNQRLSCKAGAYVVRAPCRFVEGSHHTVHCARSAEHPVASGSCRVAGSPGVGTFPKAIFSQSRIHEESALRTHSTG
jgi:hypothetical protein